MYGVCGRTKGINVWPKTLLVRRNSTTSPTNPDVAQQLRIIMRSCAQPVTIVSTRLTDSNNSFHGATLSSFSSIGMHPLPLVALSIRKPSRLADALHFNRHTDPDAIHGVINILAAQQSQLAIQFSRPDLYPKPFSCAPHRLEGGFPVLGETVGSLMFSVLTTLPLSDEVLQKFGALKYEQAIQGEDMSSELFVARVIRVLTHGDDSDQARKPLIYHQGGYGSVDFNEPSS